MLVRTLTSKMAYICFACAPILLACSDKEPCFPGSMGKEYRINIVELWNANSQYPGGDAYASTCPSGFDLAAGSSIVLRIDDFVENDGKCLYGEGRIVEPPVGWAWEAVSRKASQGTGFYNTVIRAENSVCLGSVTLQIMASKVPTGAAVPGKAPPATAMRQFYPTAPADQHTSCTVQDWPCADHFVVEIEEL
jgi:hypothetical protein